MRDQRLDKHLEAEVWRYGASIGHLVLAMVIGFSCRTQLSWKRRMSPSECVACEPGVAEYPRKEKL